MRREARHPVRLRPADDLYVRRSDKPSLELGSGRFKAHDKAVQTLAAEKLVWYAMGDAREVERLLGFVRGVGKLVHHGMGSVGSWCVEEVDEDWSVFNGDVLTRRIPLCEQTRGKGVMSYGPTRPPYHTICAERLKPCVDPVYKALIA
jgi:hypothetical protein